MKTTEVISIDGRQAVALPDEFRFANAIVSIRKHGEGVILEPVKASEWPADFFDAIRIDDPSFVRPPQDDAPHIPAIDTQ